MQKQTPFKALHTSFFESGVNLKEGTVCSFCFYQIQAGVAMSLGSLHFDDLLDYGPQLADKAGSEIVKKHYGHLNLRVKPKMDDRNKARLRYGYLTYPWLTPGWVPNSICT